MGLGRLSAVFPVVLPRGRSGAGRDLPDRAAGFFILLSSHFFARQRRHGLDDLELSALLRLKTQSLVSDQPPASGSLILATLSESPRFSQPQWRRSRSHRAARRRTDSGGDGKRSARPDRTTTFTKASSNRLPQEK